MSNDPRLFSEMPHAYDARCLCDTCCLREVSLAFQIEAEKTTLLLRYASHSKGKKR